MSKATIDRINFRLMQDEQGKVWYSYMAAGFPRIYEANYSNQFEPRANDKGLRPVRLSFRKGLELGAVVTVAKSSYVLAQEDDGSPRLLAVKVAQKVWRTLIPRSYFETGENAKKLTVTRGEASRFIEGVQSALRVMNAYNSTIPAKATGINRSASTRSAASGGRRNGKAIVELRPFSVSVAGWIQNGFCDYKTVDHVWSGSKWRRTTDPYRIGQAVAIHEAAHVLQYNGGLLRRSQEGHSPYFKGLLRQLIRDCGADVWAVESRKSKL